MVHADVLNDEEHAKYAVLAGPCVEKFGGKFLARGGAFHQMEEIIGQNLQTLNMNFFDDEG